MRLSTFASGTLLTFILCSALSVQRVTAQNFTQVSADQKKEKRSMLEKLVRKSCDKTIAIHISPTKAVAGEMPVMVAVRVTPSWMVEAGVGPAFRDRVAERIFDGKTLQLLAFHDRDAEFQMGYGVYAGARYLIDKSIVHGFYINPEIAYLHRNVLYPANRANTAEPFSGSVKDLNARILLGCDRAWFGSEHVFYGGFLGFGMRRYAARFYTTDASFDPGERYAVEAIPTLHFGYRVGYKF